ncbi:MAG: D-glycero-beta-D-manno-heptose 1-phosphate adenylyltransferase [Actinomycetes bacterium]
MDSLTDVVARFSGTEVVVLGDAMLDTWLEGSATRLCREAPVPALTVKRRREEPGGAANAAANLAALGARVHLVSVVGDDADGERLVRRCAEAGVDVSGVIVEAGRHTVAKQRLVADGTMLARFDEGLGDGAASEETVGQLLAAARKLLRRVPVLVVCDYATGLLDADLRPRLGALVREGRPLVVLDAHDPRRWRDLRPDVVAPNWDEAVLTLPADEGVDRTQWLSQHGETLLDEWCARSAAVTLDSEGAVFIARQQRPHRAYAHPVSHPDTCGAGDSFTAALTLSLAQGADPSVALEAAVAAAGVVVRKSGTATCTQSALLEQIGILEPVAAPDVLVDVVAEHRAAGRRVVFTNGCFDVLHSGHVAMLDGARRLGDVLVVAVNSDESVRRLKGPDRPVNPLGDRLRVLAALSCVDHLVVFDEDSPAELIARLQPDVYAKGGDYTPETLPEAPVVESYGGAVRFVDFVADHSTTRLLDRIRSLDGPLDASVTIDLRAPLGELPEGGR